MEGSADPPIRLEAGIDGGMNYHRLTQTLVESFNALADEIQSLTDRKTVLAHKLEFAREQFQYLADKHAPAAPEISETLAKLQLPPDLSRPSLKEATSVPLPRRLQSDTQHRLALIIRDGRRAAQQLSTLGESSKTSLSSREMFSRDSHVTTTMSTALEQDFTVEGRKGQLRCPFSAAKPDIQHETEDMEVLDGVDEKAISPHGPADPICAAMYDETMPQPGQAATTTTTKCPIRFLDQHSPEEIAQYVETHKHELPRSHEVCLRRHNKSEEHIRKLDAKYGNLVSMVQELSQLHQPMLPEDEPQRQSDIDRASNERVENWAQTVSTTAPHAPEQNDAVLGYAADADRESHFDRPLREVRVGESPSRPWGISVPIYEPVGLSEDGRPLSPPPAPGRMPSPDRSNQTPAKAPAKCPFDHTKLDMVNSIRSSSPKVEGPSVNGNRRPSLVSTSAPVKPQAGTSAIPQHATFIKSPEGKAGQHNTPQMLFTGPVFIGYPIEQAIQFMQHLQNQ